jgi:hypothetical protein
MELFLRPVICVGNAYESDERKTYRKKAPNVNDGIIAAIILTEQRSLASTDSAGRFTQNCCKRWTGQSHRSMDGDIGGLEIQRHEKCQMMDALSFI